MNTAEEIKIFRLEDRILFEAAAAAEVVDAIQNADANIQNANEKKSQDISNVNVPFENNSANIDNTPVVEPADIADVNAEIDALIEGIIPQGDNPADNANDNSLTISTERELVVINSSVNNLDSILENIRPDQDVLILNERNGLAELNEYLDNSEFEYSAIHFVTHGNDGEISVNGELVNNDSFFAEDWQEVGKHLTADGDIYFYGCDVAANEAGQILINRIAEASNADVAASTDTTGVSGNWELEYVVGTANAEYLCVNGYNWDLTVITSERDLQDAIENAAAIGGDVTLEVGNIEFSNTVYGFFDKDLNLEIQGIDNAVLTGADGYYYNMFDFSADDNVDVNISADDITFQNGGSAIYTFNINLTITDSSFSNFSTSAIYFDSLSSIHALNIENSVFIDNISYPEGGAIYASGGDVTISKSYFSGNQALGGGAIYTSESSLTINDSSFDNNIAVGEGGGAIAFIDGNTLLSVSNSTFYKNTAENGVGGAIRLFDETSTIYNASITNSTFTANTAEEHGNAIFNGIGTLTIDNTLLVSNGTDDLWQATSGGITTVTNSMITAIEEGSGTINAADQVNSEYTANNIFNISTNLDDLYEAGSHTLELNPFHKAAWSGADAAADAVDQLGTSRNIINSTLGISGMYSIGAVTAKAAIFVSANDAETTYSGSEITPPNEITVTYADGTTVVNKAINSVTFDSAPTLIKAAGSYNVTPSDIDFTDIDENSVAIQYNAGTLVINKAVLTISVGTTEISKTYDGNADVENSDKSYIISGLLGTDTANVTSADWAYCNVNASNSINISVNDIRLDADISENYTWNTSFTANGTITAKTVDAVFSTAEPYYYNGTDQSGTVSATYTDINGNTVNAVINWNGETFTNPGTYTVTVESNNTNYVINSASAVKVLVMNTSIPTSATNPIYSEGNYPGFSNNNATMEAEIISGDVKYNTQTNGNFSNLRFSDLIRCTMLDYLYDNDNAILKDFRNVVSVDALKYRPMEIDNITSDISDLTANSKISHPHSFFIGKEIFIGNNYNDESDNVIYLRGDTYSYEHEAIVIEKDYHLEDVDIMTYSVALNNIELTSEYDIATTAHDSMEKITNFKSDVEKIIDSMLG